jgi:Flp pilus assembly protein TadB
MNGVLYRSQSPIPGLEISVPRPSRDLSLETSKSETSKTSESEAIETRFMAKLSSLSSLVPKLSKMSRKVFEEMTRKLLEVKSNPSGFYIVFFFPLFIMYYLLFIIYYLFVSSLFLFVLLFCRLRFQRGGTPSSES